MNISNPLSRSLHLPVFVILLAAAALAIAALQWLAGHLRGFGRGHRPRPVSREFAERFYARTSLPHRP